MEIRYDPEVDILVVNLVESLVDSPGATEMGPGAYVDVTDAGKILSIEILNASQKYPLSELMKHPAAYTLPTLTLTEAAQRSGIDAQALKKACQQGRLEGRKAGRDWVVSEQALHNYQNSRIHAGPGSRAAG